METNEQILIIIREKGPLLPVQVSKEINDNILMTSARLSELLSDKKIKISNLKVGGSPLYYSSGQESKLQNFADNLGGMEKKAYDLLERNKILKDASQEPAIRVALRQIKDFAVPLQVNYQNKSEIFWKWYMVNNKDAEPIIRDLLAKPRKEEIVPGPTEKVDAEKPLNEPKEVKNKVQQELKKDATKKIKKTEDKIVFLKNTHDFFNKNKINIIETKDTKKSSETDFIIGLQTSIGVIKYFCKSKNKKKINDADLSSAVVQAQSKNLPLLFLTNGALTKKAQEMLNNEFKNITFRNI